MLFFIKEQCFREAQPGGKFIGWVHNVNHIAATATLYTLSGFCHPNAGTLKCIAYGYYHEKSSNMAGTVAYWLEPVLPSY